MPIKDNDEIKFVYGFPAMIAGKGKNAPIVVGDIHIGMESKLRKFGIRLYDMAALMAREILRMASEFGTYRALQLAYGAPPLIKVPEGIVDPLNLAELEFEKGVIPITIIRQK